MFSFLSGIFLWALPLVGIPVAIHLLHRRRRNVVRWGAMRFLLEAASRRRRMWRWDEWLLMALRVLAVALLVFVLARPLMRTTWLSRAGSRELILLLDTSMSTTGSAQDAGRAEGVRLDEIVRRGCELIDELNDGDQVRIQLASAAPCWLVDEPATIDSASVDRLRSQLAGVRPTQAGGDMLRCVGQALATQPDSRIASRVLAVVTDGQAYGWRVDAGQAWRRLQEKAASMTPATMLTVIDVAAKTNKAERSTDPFNFSVQSVASSRQVTAPGRSVLFSAVVTNTGSLPAPASGAHWFQGEQSLGITALPSLDPGESATVTISHVFDEPGVYTIACQIERADVLLPDSRGCAVIEVVNSVPVLIVDGSPRANPMDNQTGYLLAALGGMPTETDADRTSVFVPKVIGPADLGKLRSGDACAVVCVNVSCLDDTQMACLCEFVRRGGGAWFVLGSQTNPTFFNETIFAEHTALSPLPVGKPTGDEANHEQFERVRPPLADHAATHLLADTNRLDMDRGRIYRRLAFEMPVGDDTTSILLATDQGAPLVVEKTLGRGRSLIQAFPLDARWSNLPLCQAFVVMTHEWLWYLAESSLTRWNLDPGETLAASFPADRFDDLNHLSGKVEDPQDQVTELNARIEEGRFVCRFSETQLPGSYKLILADQAGDSETFAFEVRRDPAESELKALSDEDRQLLTKAGGWRFVSDPLAQVAAAAVPVRTEPIWAWLMIALLGLFLLELVLAGYLTRRRAMLTSPMTLVRAGSFPREDVDG